MPGLKRSRVEEGAAPGTSSSSSTKPINDKKIKKNKDQQPSTSTSTSLLSAQEVDFPRGGGSGLTPLEFREAKSEARSESAANELLFKDAKDEQAEAKRKKMKQKLNREKRNDAKKKRTSSAPSASASKSNGDEKEHYRIQHLSYKRLVPGSRMLCSVLAIHPLAIVVSLPNQMLGHIPVTQISPQFTHRLQMAADAAAEADDDDEDMEDQDSASESDDGQEKEPKLDPRKVPELQEIFHVGQWLTATVLQVRGPEVAKGKSHREGGEYEKESRRVELTLAPHVVNTGVTLTDLDVGSTMSATISSLEDHGYMLDSGIPEFAGFVSYKEAAKLPEVYGAGKNGKRLQVGAVVHAKITKIPENRRSFEAVLDPKVVTTSVLKNAPSITAVLPGSLTKVLVTAALPTGLNVKLFGMFDATIDRFHLPELPEGKDIPDVYKEGSKHVARVLWDLLAPASTALQAENPDEERKFGLSLAPQVLAMQPPQAKSGELLQHAYPIGTTLKATVVQTIKTSGLIVAIKDTDLRGFVHISQVADDTVVALPPTEGAYRKGTKHEARVIGHSPTDRVLQLSLKPSVLEKKFMRVSEIEIGEVVTATIIRLGLPNAIFLSLGGNTDGVVFSNHFADIKLTQPEKRFKPGLQVKARVLDVDPSRNRIVLTCKKTLVKSDLPIVSGIQDARVGVVTHATVFRVLNNAIIVSLFGGLKALVPGKEASESSFEESKSGFSEGKVVKIRITDVDYEESKIVASIKQSSADYLAKLNVDAVEVGEKVTGKVAAVHKEVVVLTLVPSGVRALLSLSVLAKMRSTTTESLQESLEEDQEIQDLVVSTKNPEKGLVICADQLRSSKGSQPGTGNSNGTAVADGEIKVGAVVNGRVLSRNDKFLDCLVALGTSTRATLHITDVADEYTSETQLPSPGQVIRCFIVSMKSNGKSAVVSTRPSKLSAAASASDASTATVVDAEIHSIKDLEKGQKVRGFVKSITSVGLFVTIGRKLDARVQVRELFDEFVRDWKTKFTVGQVVTGTIMDLDSRQNQVEMSLKSEPGSTKPRSEKQAAAAAEADANRPKRFHDFSMGEKVKGFIKSIVEFGVFVQVEGSTVSGLCHMTELSDGTNPQEALKAFRVGDKVRAIVLRKNDEKRTISFGLKASYFDAADFEDSDEDEDNDSEDEDDDDSDVEMDGAELADGDSEDEDDDDDDENDDDDDDEEEGDFIEMDEDEDEASDSDREVTTSKAKAKASTKKPIASLALAGGFSWSAEGLDDDEDGVEDSDSSDSDDEGEEEDRASTKQKSNKKKNKQGSSLEEDLTADLASKAPESATDFERLLLGSPNSSFLWIQFMSFQLQLSDVDSARELARRALKVINYREEQERMNVWIALLNLENTYGSQETLIKTFREAVQQNDGFTMYLKMIQILQRSSKISEAEELFLEAKAKRYSILPEFWIEWSKFYLETSQGDKSRALLPRALQALEKRDHISTICSFGIQEYRIGDVERGRTIFEGLVDTYPKKLDLWWQYIDQESRIQDNQPQVRNLFERVLTGVKLSAKKGKSIFKKWLDYEKRKGDQKSQQHVIQKAKQFVDELNASKIEAMEEGQDAMEDEDDD